MSFLTRRLKFRPKYLNVYEFQANGRLHLHILFFGLRFLISVYDISDMWKRYGQGQIVDTKLLKTDGTTWQWTHGKPKDAGEKEKPDTYLKKYLKKNLFDDNASMQYWIYNTRFFTCSQSFNKAKKRFRGLGWYRFLGVFYEGSAPRHNPYVQAWGVGVDPPRKREVSRDLQIINNLCQLA